MDEGGSEHGSLSRRAVLRGVLKASAYTAPMILSVSVAVSPALAVSPIAPFICVQPRTEFLVVFGRNQAPSTSRDFYVAANTVPRGPLIKVGSYTTDASGFVTTTAFPVTFDYSVVRSVLVYTSPVGLIPTFPVGSYTPNPALNCTPGTTGIAPSLEVIFTQRTTNATPAPQYIEYVGVNLINVSPGAVYDVYISPNNAIPAGIFTKAGTGTVNTSGVMPFFAPVTVATQPGTGIPSTLTVNVVSSGAPATPPIYTQTVSSALNPSVSTPTTSDGQSQQISFADRS